jgi:carboxyl-terminal processing protease
MKTLRLAVLIALFSAVLVLGSTVLAVLAVRAGLLDRFLPPGASDLPADFKQLREVYTILHSDYVEPERLDAKALSEGAIRGMLESLDDPYTDYIAADAYSVRTDDLQGEFGGIGAEVSAEDGRIVVVRVLPGTPAEEAGLTSGDIILQVDGASVEGKTVGDVVSLIRGKEGTTVRILVHSDGQDTQLELTRRRITISSVELSMVDDVPYVQVSRFSESTDEDVEAALRTLDLRNIPGVVIDLRGNSGGLLESVLATVGHFLDNDQVVLYQRDRNGKETERKTSARGIAADVPVVVLVDRLTASASEIFAGAIQDHGRGPLIGESTYGKGSVGLLFNLSGGAGLTVTSARWLTPDHRLIEGDGLEPDVALLDDQETEDVDEALERAVEEVKARRRIAEMAHPGVG